MNTLFSLIVLGLPLFTFTNAGGLHDPGRRNAAHHIRAQHHARARTSNSSTSPNSKRATASYTLVDHYQGTTFFDDWDFYDQADPTDGFVNFLAESDARTKNLAYTQPDNTVVIAVDDYTTLAAGQNRNSVRISSKKTYQQGLFIMDLYAMPHGCSVWPAWWTLGTGAAWPQAGEIDIIEGVHQNTNNQYTLHTGSGCSLDPNPAGGLAGTILGTTCASSNGDNDGCGVQDPSSSSYGHQFNLGDGGVFAMLWDDDGIKTYRFARGSIPSDINAMTPNPSSWGQPVASWSASSCDPNSNFKEHAMIIDTTLCGQWAGATFASAGCGNSCQDFIQDPSNFKLAKWMINYVATYTAN